MHGLYNGIHEHTNDDQGLDRDAQAIADDSRLHWGNDGADHHPVGNGGACACSEGGGDDGNDAVNEAGPPGVSSTGKALSESWGNQLKPDGIIP